MSINEICGTGLQAKQPQVMNKWPLHFEKVTMWSSTAIFEILDPYFFEEAGCTVIVNTQHCLELIENSLLAELLCLGRDIDDKKLRLLQDWATSYIAQICTTLLRQMFPKRLLLLLFGFYNPSRVFIDSIIFLRLTLFFASPLRHVDLLEILEHTIQQSCTYPPSWSRCCRSAVEYALCYGHLVSSLVRVPATVSASDG